MHGSNSLHEQEDQQHEHNAGGEAQFHAFLCGETVPIPLLQDLNDCTQQEQR